MAHFVECDDGSWINLDHVARVKQAYGGSTCFYGPDDNRLGDVSYFLPAYLSAPAAIPALPEALAVLIAVCDADGEDFGRPDHLADDTVPIIGWRVIDDVAAPVLLEKPMSNQIVLILLPDGRLMEQEGSTYDDLPDAMERILMRAQAIFDHEQKRKAEAKAAAE